MKFFNQSADELISKFIYQDRPQGEPILESETEDVSVEDALTIALREAALNPEDSAQEAELDFAIEAAVTELVERGITLDIVDTYFEQRDDEPLAIGEIDGIANEIEEAVVIEGAPLTAEETTELQTMSNSELLEIPSGDRLRLITTQNVTSDEVAMGTANTLTFTFTFEGQYNEALWRDTTAGQVLPPEVRSVNSGGQVFTRHGNALTGEFFSERGQRLKIHEGTNISDMERGDLSEIQAQIESDLAAFEQTEDGESRPDGEMLVARLALENGVQPEFVMAAFVAENQIETEDAPHMTSDEARLASMPGATARQQLAPAYRAQLEYFLTDIGRAEGDFNGRFDEATRTEEGVTPALAAFFLAESNTDEAIGEIMEGAGYSDQEIEDSTSYASARREHNSRGATNALNSEILESGQVEVVPSKQEQVNQAVEFALANQARYERVADITGVPWELIAGIHYRESSGNFDTYLHNGQRLGQVTTIVPRGVYFTNWEDAAIDALQGGYGNPSEDDLASQANFAERFNGMGYNNRGLTSPYVWAGHPSYESQGGMYVADGEFSQTTRDPRIGVMPIVMVLRARQGLGVEVE